MRGGRPDLRISIGGLSLKNPVMIASGTGGYGEEYGPFVDLSRLGAFVTKGISLRPRVGNPPSRIAETSCGLLNAIGLANIGLDAFLQERLPCLQRRGVTTIVNVFGETVEEYREMARRLSFAEGVSAIELNVSCPNVKRGGMAFGTDPEVLFRLVREVREASEIPLFVKLSPNVQDISLLAKAAEEAGADALTVANTFLGMAVNWRTRRPSLATVIGGLSGPAIKPLTMKLVWDTVRCVRIPVIAVGGITASKDAIEYLIVGARAVQIGTGNFSNPCLSLKVIEGIERYLEEHRMASVEELVGSLES